MPIYAGTILELPEFKKYNFTKKELLVAAKMAELEYQRYKSDIRKKGEETLKYLKDNKITPQRCVYVHVTVYEEVGHGG